MFLVIQIVFLSVVLLLIKKENSDFQGHGFWLPENFGEHISVGVLLALAYFFITVFLPGSFAGFELLPPVPQASLEFIEILLTSLACESVFRGYIQRNLTRVYGFLPALGVSSFMFSLYGLPLPSLPSFGLTFLFTNIVSLFILGIFLGIVFQKTMTLVCPVTFYGVLLFTHRLTPLKATIGEYTLLFLGVIAYVFLTLLVYVLVRKKFLEGPKEELSRDETLR
jgi:membrane protease YdiL (CAAX protease family)